MRMNEHGFGRKGLRQNFRTCEPGFSSHCDVIGSDKLRRRLIKIYDELVWNVVLKDFIGNFVRKL